MAQFGRAPCSGRGGRRFKSCRLDAEANQVWPVGQGVKTPPSHGGNRGSIPLLAAKDCYLRVTVFLFSMLLFAKDPNIKLENLRLTEMKIAFIISKDFAAVSKWP